MKYLLPFLMYLLLFVSIAQAQTYPLKLIIVHREDISDSVQYEWFKQANSQIPNPYKIISVKVVKDTVKKNKLSQYYSRLFDWAKHYRNPAIFTYYLLPPCWENGIDYSGGGAGAICTTTRNQSRKFAYSTLRHKNWKGDDRYEHSITATRHELLHTLGANHYDKQQNVMRSYYVPGPQPILPVTLRELEYCKQGRTPKGNFSR